jgi:hypothetical protein
VPQRTPSTGWLGAWCLSSLCLALVDCSSAVSCSTSAPISGQVLNNTTGGTVASALVILQNTRKGADSSNPNAATTQYNLATPTDSQGNFTIEAPCGPFNVIGVAPGFVASVAPTFAGRAITLGMTQNDANAVLPTVSGFVPAANPLTAGAATHFTASLTAPANDPLSDKVLLINTTVGLVVGFRPPAAPSGTGAYPNGEWTADLRAPTTPGVYRYGLVAMTGSGQTLIQYISVNTQRAP